MGMTAVFPVIEKPRVVLLVAVDAFLACFGDAAVDDNRADMTQIPSCVKCHLEAEENLEQSVHYISAESPPQDEFGNELKLPTCIDCHRVHDVVTTNQDAVSLNVTEDCGNCHQDLMDTYFGSYHGKRSRLLVGSSH